MERAAQQPAGRGRQNPPGRDVCPHHPPIRVDNENAFVDRVSQEAAAARVHRFGGSVRDGPDGVPQLRPTASEKRRAPTIRRRSKARVGGLQLHCRPRVDLRTGTVMGVEARVRWQHPRLGLLGPAAFITLAEDSGLIRELGGWVLREACQQAADWHAGDPDRWRSQSTCPRVSSQTRT